MTGAGVCGVCYQRNKEGSIQAAFESLSSSRLPRLLSLDLESRVSNKKVVRILNRYHVSVV